MPIECPINFPRLSTEEFGALDYEVMRLAFAGHKDIGRLADENVYQADIASRVANAGYDVHLEVPILVRFHTFLKIYYTDIVIAHKAVYEVKAVTRLTVEHESQLMNYMLLVDCGRGKLINFRPASVESRFVNVPVTLEQRRSFQVVDHRWRGESTTKDWMIELLRDWGTCLELPLYLQCFVHFLGGDETVIKQLPMRRGDISLGNQRFHLLTPDAAFQLTAFRAATKGYDTQLKRLLKLSPLKAIHWINIGHEVVSFATID